MSRQPHCDFGDVLVVCRITDESIAASLRVDLDAVRERIRRRSLREQRREAKEQAEEARIARAFAKALRDSEIRELAGLDTLRECAKRFGLSHERIRQIQAASPPRTERPRK